MARKRSAERTMPVADSADEVEEKRRAREQWERQRADDLRERDEVRRSLLNVLEIWTLCPHKICRRNRRCSGDTDECLTQRWHRFVPEDTRQFVAKVIQLRHDGMAAAEAVEAAKADIKHRAEIAARCEARGATRSNSP